MIVLKKSTTTDSIVVLFLFVLLRLLLPKKKLKLQRRHIYKWPVSTHTKVREKEKKPICFFSCCVWCYCCYNNNVHISHRKGKETSTISYHPTLHCNGGTNVTTIRYKIQQRWKSGGDEEERKKDKLLLCQAKPMPCHAMPPTNNQTIHTRYNWNPARQRERKREKK